MKFTIISVAVTLLATVNAQRPSRSSSTPKIDSHICDYQSNGYFFSTLRTHGLDARSYCASIRSELVDVDNSNFAGLTQMIVKCLGPGQKAWINSWDGNTFANSPLAIWTGLQSGSGSININIQKEPLFAICSDRGYSGGYDDSLASDSLAAPDTASVTDSNAATDASSLAEDTGAATDSVDGSDLFPVIDQVPAEAFDFSVDEYELPGALAEQEFSDADEEAVESLFNAAVDKVMDESNFSFEDSGSDFVPGAINIEAAKDLAGGNIVVENDIQSDFPQMFGYPFPGLDSVNA